MQVYEQLQAKLGYLERQADETMVLLHGVSEAGRSDPAIYDYTLQPAPSRAHRRAASWPPGGSVNWTPKERSGPATEPATPTPSANEPSPNGGSASPRASCRQGRT